MEKFEKVWIRKNFDKYVNWLNVFYTEYFELVPWSAPRHQLVLEIFISVAGAKTSDLRFAEHKVIIVADSDFCVFISTPGNLNKFCRGFFLKFSYPKYNKNRSYSVANGMNYFIKTHKKLILIYVPRALKVTEVKCPEKV